MCKVKEAVEAVVHILKMIEAFIEDVIRFLTTLFDWGAILDAHKILKQIANNQMRDSATDHSARQDDFSKLIIGVLTAVPRRSIPRASELTNERNQFPRKRSTSRGCEHKSIAFTENTLTTKWTTGETRSTLT